MLSDNGFKCCPQLTRMRAYAVSGIKDITEFAEDMNTYTETLPDDLKPIAQALTDSIMKLLTQACIEYLTMLSELGYQEIIRTTATSDVAARSPKHYPEPE